MVKISVSYRQRKDPASPDYKVPVIDHIPKEAKVLCLTCLNYKSSQILHYGTWKRVLGRLTLRVSKWQQREIFNLFWTTCAKKGSTFCLHKSVILTLVCHTAVPEIKAISSVPNILDNLFASPQHNEAGQSERVTRLKERNFR